MRPELQPESEPSPSRAIWRGLAKRCPRCGEGRLIDGFYRVRTRCDRCDWLFEREVGDHLGIIYISTAIQTATFAAVVLWIQPSSPWTARILLGAAALGLMLLNLPNRKGLAVAIDYLSERNRDKSP